jgi:hypothetical protein
MRTAVVELRAAVPDRPHAEGAMSDEELALREQDRRAVIDAVAPVLSSLPERPLHRFGNVSQVTLLGGEMTQGRWTLLVLAETDSVAPGLERELLEVLPEGSEVSSLGTLGRIAVWPEPADS